MRASTVAVELILAVLLSGLVGSLIGSSQKVNTTVTATSTLTVTTSVGAGSEVQGIVTGSVTIGGQTISNMSGYGIVFVPKCSAGTTCPATIAEIYPTGHYSILLNPGNYTVTGLFPSCKWAGCSSAFPQKVSVGAGMQVVFNIDL